MSRDTEIHRSDWKGILIEITYVPQWLPPGVLGEDLAHLQVQSIYPTDAPLPITETGYRSHFIAASAIAAAGGPIAYVDIWLAAESERPEWRQHEKEARQLTLF